MVKASLKEGNKPEKVSIKTYNYSIPDKRKVTLENLEMILNLERNYPGMFIKVMTNFGEAKSHRETLNDKGKPIKVPWEEALKKFYLSNKYVGVTKENSDIAQVFGSKGLSQDTFDIASKLRQKAKTTNVPEHILEKPIRDYIGEGDKISTIGDVQLNVSQYKSLYMVTAKIDDIYIDVETEGITESQLLELLQSLVIEIRSNKNSGIDVDANVKEMANENLDYPSYYAGMFIDNEGKNVILLCEDSIQNRKEICAKLGITQSKTTFKKAKYSYNYLKELQEKISKKMQNKELDFITSSALMEDSNNIKVNVKSKNESDIDKIRQLDKVGGAIDIQYDESTVPKKDLLIEKE